MQQPVPNYSLEALEQDNANLDDEAFWTRLADSILHLPIQEFDAESHRLYSLINKDRCNNPSRYSAMTDAELGWLWRAIQRKKPVRVYRAAPIGQIAGFRFHTSLKSAMDEIAPKGGEPLKEAHLFIGEVDPEAILFRIMGDDNRKWIIAFPDRVRALKVDQLTHESAVEESV